MAPVARRWWTATRGVAASLLLVAAVGYAVSRYALSWRSGGDSGESGKVAVVPAPQQSGLRGSFASAGPSTLAPSAGGDHPAPNSDGPGLAVLTSADVSHHVATYARVLNDYDHKAEWYVDVDGNTDVGVHSEHPAVSGGVVIFKLVLTRDHVPVSSAILGVAQGRVADLKVPLGGNGYCRYTLGAPADGVSYFNVRADLHDSRDAAVTIASLATTLSLGTGKSESAGRVSTPQGLFELSIAVARASVPNL